MVGFEKALGTVKVIKDRIQYRSQSLLNLARGYSRQVLRIYFIGISSECFSDLVAERCQNLGWDD